MKKWNINIKNNPQEIIEKLQAGFQSGDGFIFKTNADKNEALQFDVRKRVLYPDQILHRNRIVVNGKILKTDSENEANIEIAFSQHIFLTLTVFTMVLTAVWLIFMIAKISSGATLFALIVIALLLSVALWFALQKKFEKDIQKYKHLISEILLT